MIFVTIYAVGIWVVAWRWRRRWQGFAAIVAGTPPIFLSAQLDIWLVNELFHEDVHWLLMMAFAFAGVIVFIGLLLAVQPRAHPAHACQECGYDLRGLASTLCPECGNDSCDDLPTPRPVDHAEPVAPDFSLGVQLADRRRDRNRDSSKLSAVTPMAPPIAQPPTTSQ